MVYRFRTFPFVSLLAVQFALGAPIALANKGDTTWTVAAKFGIGDITIGYKINDKPVQPVTVHVGLADNFQTIAANIAAAVGHGATASGSTVTLPSHTGFAGGDNLSVEAILNRVVKLKLNTDGYALGNQPAGALYFAANPVSGTATLDSSAVVTAGFASGLAPVSFDAAAGESIFNLTAQLDAALVAGGYTTDLLGPLDIAVFADGSLSPAELDFSVVPDNPVAPDGIVFGLSNNIPEPSTLALLGAGLIALLARVRRLSG